MDSSTTTDRAIERIKQDAKLDLDFINNDIHDLQQSYADFIRMSYSNSVEKLSKFLNQTYEKDMPNNTEEYNLECLQGIYDEVEDMRQDLNIGVAMCANLSQSVGRINENLEHFKVIISSLDLVTGNLTNQINMCIEKFPKTSWDRLQCVVDQAVIVTNQFNPVFNQFKMFNMAMNGHLMFLGVETSLCYQESLQKLSEINKTILSYIASCKI